MHHWYSPYIGIPTPTTYNVANTHRSSTVLIPYQLVPSPKTEIVCKQNIDKAYVIKLPIGSVDYPHVNVSSSLTQRLDRLASNELFKRWNVTIVQCVVLFTVVSALG